MKKFAFTMLELVFVIVVVGILAAVFIPKMDRNNIEEAALQVTRHIRYTQHLAMSDDVYDASDPYYYQKRWHISFVQTAACGLLYSVGSDRDNSNKNTGNAGKFTASEAATDPLTNSLIYNDSLTCAPKDGWYKDVLLGEYFDIDSITTSGGCTTQTLAFDNIGRPYTALAGTSATTNKLASVCTLTLKSGTKEAYIRIEPETGYTHFPTYNF